MPASRAGDDVATLRLAITFLTIAPIRVVDRAQSLSRAAGWFPLVGAGIGAVAGGIGWLARPALGSTVAAVLTVAALVVSTGALHQDGLGDCADAVGARGGDRNRRLEVMRDPSIGTFGALALALWLMLMVAALSGLSRTHAFCAIVVATTLGRWAALLHAAASAPARHDGLGAGFTVSLWAMIVPTGVAAAAALGIEGPGRGAAALAAVGAVSAFVTLGARSLFGGRTGDSLGAAVALAEVAVVLTLLGLS